MNLKALTAATIAVLALTACDESTSASDNDSNTPTSSSTITTSSSDASTPTSDASTPTNDESTPTNSTEGSPTTDTLTVIHGANVDGKTDADDPVPASNPSGQPDEGEASQTSSASNNPSTIIDNSGIVCTGEPSDDKWVASIKGITQGVTIDATAEVIFNGTTMTSNNNSKIDMMSPELCQTMVLFSSMGDEEDDVDADLYGNVVGETEMSCEGSMLTMKETRVRENVTDADREAIYNDMMTECKDYRDGKKSLDEFIDDEE